MIPTEDFSDMTLVSEDTDDNDDPDDSDDPDDPDDLMTMMKVTYYIFCHKSYLVR